MVFNIASIRARTAFVACLAFANLAAPQGALAAPLTSATRDRLVRGEYAYVIVEYDGRAAERDADAVRMRRRLLFEDASALSARRAGYARIKAAVTTHAGGGDAQFVHDYDSLPLAVWRLSSLAALDRLEAHALVRRVHENRLLRAISVSDLGFINQPQVAALGDTGAGTSIAVIDGGLGSNYLSYSDFGACTAVGTPASTCRVVYDVDYYTGNQASAETVHGTNVSAIALGVAPSAKLLMLDVFNGTSATSTDLLSAMNTVIGAQAAYSIVALNLSLGDGSSHSSACSGSVFESAVASAARVGITTVAAAGNSGSKSGLSDPACAPGVVSVGAVYDSGYGTVGWVAPADAGGQCVDASQAGLVTCFSQSAAYLSLLAPGTFVNAPNGSFQESGTSQATPHVSGAVAVLRSRYPAESLRETLQRLTGAGVATRDPANGVTTPRLDLLAAVDLGTSLSLSGTGPTTATAGAAGTYTLTATNAGPLDATNVSVSDSLPPGATVTSLSPGCSVSGAIVTCLAAALAANSNVTFTINVSFSVTGPVYDTASVRADQIDSAPASAQTVHLGTPPDAPLPTGDGPLPAWSYALLFVLLSTIGAGRLRAAARLGR